MLFTRRSIFAHGHVGLQLCHLQLWLFREQSVQLQLVFRDRSHDMHQLVCRLVIDLLQHFLMFNQSVVPCVGGLWDVIRWRFEQSESYLQLLFLPLASLQQKLKLLDINQIRSPEKRTDVQHLSLVSNLISSPLAVLTRNQYFLER